MHHLPKVLNRPRRLPFYGPEDYLGGDVEDDLLKILDNQIEWDSAYSSLNWWEKLRYNFLGYY